VYSTIGPLVSKGKKTNHERLLRGLATHLGSWVFKVQAHRKQGFGLSLISKIKQETYGSTP